MEQFTVEQFQERFDELLGRVENGEHIGITDGNNDYVMVPADDELIRIYTELNNEAP
jgi:antitoxin (DNA-binding transcriptional repressor) of toxin-antitoxin stability system